MNTEKKTQSTINNLCTITPERQIVLHMIVGVSYGTVLYQFSFWDLSPYLRTHAKNQLAQTAFQRRNDSADSGDLTGRSPINYYQSTVRYMFPDFTQHKMFRDQAHSMIAGI